jgi:TatD DNase family protein
MKIIDVHCHLDSKRFEKDLNEVIARFKKVGGKFIINSGVNKETNRKCLELAERFDIVRLSFGLYPIDALAKEIESGEASDFLRKIEEFDVDEELAWIEKHSLDCVAIGEIGLDYNWKEFQTDEMRDAQKDVFRKCLRLAKRINKPVVIHSRKAELDAIEILESEGIKKVVMHCFNGKKSLIRRVMENGWFFSVPAVIVRLQHFQTLVDMVPLEQILTETDGAYLAPVAGTRNEPVNVVVTLKEIARIKGMKESEVASVIFDNAIKLFNL